MTPDMIFVVVLLVAALVAFALDWLGVDLITLLVVSTLVLRGILTPEEAFRSFASEIVFILGAVFIVSGALVRTGVMEWLGQALYRYAGQSESRAQFALMGLSATMSAFVNNTNSTAVLIPAASELGQRGGFARSRLLMPLAYASILGGTCTVIGTSTNVAASGMLRQLGQEPFGLFEFTGVGLAVAGVGLLYLGTIGYRLLPVRRDGTLTTQYHIADYLSVVTVPDESSFVGMRLDETPFGKWELNVLQISRGAARVFPGARSKLRAGDELIVHGTREALMRVQESRDLRVEGEGKEVPPPSPGDPDRDLSAAEVRLAEAIVMPSSSFAGSTLADLRFREHFGITVLAIHRRGYGMASHIRDLPLRSGDVLLLQGPLDRVTALQDARDVLLLGEVAHVPFRRRRGAIAAASLIAAVVAGGLNLVPLSIALLLAGVVVVAARCVQPSDAYQLIDWRLLILIGGMTSLGVAMEKTGAASELAARLVQWTLPAGELAVLAVLGLLTMLLTQPLSNAAAVLVVLPIAMSTAAQLDANPRTFAVMVTLSASLSFITPFEPASLLVYGPGGYRFRDFVQQGAVLTALCFAVLLLMVPWIWPT